MSRKPSLTLSQSQLPSSRNHVTHKPSHQARLPKPAGSDSGAFSNIPGGSVAGGPWQHIDQGFVLIRVRVRVCVCTLSASGGQPLAVSPLSAQH